MLGNICIPRCIPAVPGVMRVVLMGILILSGNSIFLWAQKTELQSLNGDWKFRLVANEAAADAVSDFYKSEYQESGFSNIPVPSNWAIQGFE